jgi:hypothetical protein
VREPEVYVLGFETLLDKASVVWVIFGLDLGYAAVAAPAFDAKFLDDYPLAARLLLVG